MKRSKAQIALTDLFVALFIFSILIIFITLTWNRYNLRLTGGLETEEMMIKAFQVTDVLVESSGSPSDWNSTNVETIGLASHDRILSTTKVNKFINLPLNQTKTIFKIKTYDFYFSLTPIGGEIITYGNIPAGKKHIVAKRYVIYENGPAILQFTLWR